jgi:phage shock protein C
MKKRLYRSETDKKLCGVCGGFADYLNIDSSVVRLLFVIFTLMGWGAVLYIAAALIIPSEYDVGGR